MGKELQIIDEKNTDSYLSLYDSQFSIAAFNNSLRNSETKSRSIIDSVKEAIIKAQAKGDDEIKYVVDMSDEIKEAIEKGEMKLVQEKGGEFFAQIRKANGQYGAKLPIKKELASKGLTPQELQMALQMEAIREQLKDIIDSLQEIEGKVTDVIQGQKNDRVGLFYSGLSLYIEASAVQDEMLRKQITAQALKSINDSNSQMIQDLKTNLEYLVNKKYMKTKKPTEKIEEHLNNIQQCYDVIYRASFLKAMIYQENNELGPMITCIDEYARFVESLISPYVGRLSELDKNSKFIDEGAWGKIAGTLEGCKDLKKQLISNNVYVLSSGGVEYGN